MDLKSAIDILSIHNDWRRDNTGELPQVQPKILGEAIDFVVSEFKNLQNASNNEVAVCEHRWGGVNQCYSKCSKCGKIIRDD